MSNGTDPRRPLNPALLLLLVLWLAGCAALGGFRDAPRVSLVSIEPLELGLLEQRYRVALRILNPNDVELPVAGLSYSLEINDREFAYGVSRQAVTIPALGEAVLEVDVVSGLLDVLQQAQALGDQRATGIDYRLSGRLSLAGSTLRLPFEYSGRLDWQSEPADSRQ